LTAERKIGGPQRRGCGVSDLHEQIPLFRPPGSGVFLGQSIAAETHLDSQGDAGLQDGSPADALVE
jgi:hypothetical protein